MERFGIRHVGCVWLYISRRMVRVNHKWVSFEWLSATGGFGGETVHSRRRHARSRRTATPLNEHTRKSEALQYPTWEYSTLPGSIVPYLRGYSTLPGNCESDSSHWRCWRQLSASCKRNLTSPLSLTSSHLLPSGVSISIRILNTCKQKVED